MVSLSADPFFSALPYLPKSKPVSPVLPLPASEFEEDEEGNEDETETGGTLITVKISHYNPSLGGVNCANFYNGECISHLANGERWQDYFGENNTIACPVQLSFGTVIILDGNEYTCRDRGGAIVITQDGYYWIDILAESVPYRFGELRDAYLITP